jgi:hypothetical protein
VFAAEHVRLRPEASPAFMKSDSRLNFICSLSWERKPAVLNRIAVACRRFQRPTASVNYSCSIFQVTVCPHPAAPSALQHEIHHAKPADNPYPELQHQVETGRIEVRARLWWFASYAAYCADLLRRWQLAECLCTTQAVHTVWTVSWTLWTAGTGVGTRRSTA